MMRRVGNNRHWEQNKEATVYVGNLDEQVDREILTELMIQMGPVHNLFMPLDRVTGLHAGYGFVTFDNEKSANYAILIMNGIKLYNKPIRLNKATAERRTTDGTQTNGVSSIGADIFIGSLDPSVDETTIYQTFSRFGSFLAVPKVARNDDGTSKGYAFVNYASFAASDLAIDSMNGQFFANKVISVQYAYKKDGKGERHGDEAERTLAARAIANGVHLDIPAMPAFIVGGVDPQAAAYASAPNPMHMHPGFNMPAAPSPMQMGFSHPPRQYDQSPLQAPGASAGLPPRPPPSSAGYGGPMMAPGLAPPPGLSNMPPGYQGR
ncbi:hypothetical protein AMS68_004181 [Peltaster fructicola]|uniref:RRM domain-containing protein n=1 Tax=Peltaster fructicola TaxID=286661 RepID=A0A6H0XVA3_9PEZI|nr:hypothetical protein AMS68_004181 [Peltaster fructicola]